MLAHPSIVPGPIYGKINQEKWQKIIQIYKKSALVLTKHNYNFTTIFQTRLLTLESKAPSNLLILIKLPLIARDLSRLSPESSATGMGQFPICKLKWDFLRTSVTAFIIHKNVFSAPFEIFYMRTEILKKKFQKISYTTSQWGASHLQTPVSKWELR